MGETYIKRKHWEWVPISSMQNLIDGLIKDYHDGLHVNTPQHIPTPDPTTTPVSEQSDAELRASCVISKQDAYAHKHGELSPSAKSGKLHSLWWDESLAYLTMYPTLALKKKNQ
jgi:hypothetical protein